MTNISVRINAPSVIGEVLEGEAIIVNLESGAYYSLDGAGAHVWKAVASDVTTAELVELAVAAFDGPADEIAAGVTALVAELLAEGLLVANGASRAQVEPHTQLRPAALVAPAGREPFVRPILHKYTDMADLLLLDPIHEVDAQGWPHPAPRR